MTLQAIRPDLDIISEWIEPGSRVLDLGCGDGTLLSYLAKTRKVEGYGLEIDPQNVEQCIARGVSVIQTDLDEGLNDFFDDNSFNYVIMSQTLQAMRYPQKLLQEMMRVGEQGIVTFPNFGHWRTRIQLGLGGMMPVSSALPNEWYDTPNIHLCTLKDFEILCGRLGLHILQRTVVDHAHRKEITFLPNLLGEIALYRFHRG